MDSDAFQTRPLIQGEMRRDGNPLRPVGDARWRSKTLIARLSGSNITKSS
jgi:hypothetical protein